MDTRLILPNDLQAPVDEAIARAQAAAVPRWEDQDFVLQVSPPSITEYGDASEGGPLVGIVDLGLKSNIVRAMRHRGARVRVFPHTVDVSEVLSSDIDGVILSPGPGDPARLAPFLRNDLEPGVAAAHPEIPALRARLLELGALGARMTGSGSAVFALAPDEPAARRIAVELGTSHGEVFVVRTLAEGTPR